jgi:hypothetical protein
MKPLLFLTISQRMSVDDAIAKYRDSAKTIFQQIWHRYLGSNVLKTVFGSPWYKAEKLEEVIKDLVTEHLPKDEQKELRSKKIKLSEAMLLSTNPELSRCKM